jgi:cell division protein FtsW
VNSGYRRVPSRTSAVQDGYAVPRRHRPDYWLPIIAVTLLSIGLVVVYAINPGVSVQKGVGSNYFITKQLIAVLLGISMFIIAAQIPFWHWKKAVRTSIYLSIIASIIVQVLGMVRGGDIYGSYRWIQIGGVSFQVAELIKFTILLWVAVFLVERQQRKEVDNTSKTVKPILVLLGLVAFVVGAFQSDLGSTAVIVAMVGAMMFAAGVPIVRLMAISLVVIAAVLLLISTTAYRRARLATFFNPTKDCQVQGYQACQALIAVGSGGIKGLGLGHSVQAYGYLPEAANDSIFAILAEKFGFIGVTLILLLYIMFFARINQIITRAPDNFSRLLVVGILLWLSVQAMINIGAMIGLLPLKGITLPFISYGGTSLLFVTGALGIVFNISKYTTYSNGVESRRITR